MDYLHIKTKKALRAYVKSYEETKRLVIALDIEAELNRHVYGEQLCLVQIYDGENAVLIDPLDTGVELLKTLFEDTRVLKIVYDVSSDLPLLKNVYGIEVRPVIDLRPGVDLLAYEKRDLHSVIGAELGVALEKKSKFQKQNWLKRPLAKDAIEYAMNDVLYLHPLKDAMYRRLVDEGLMDTFFLKNMQIQVRDYTRDPADRYRKVKGYSRLNDEQKAVFKKIYDIREKYARRSNMPSHNIISRTELVELAQGDTTTDALRFPRRLSVDFVGSLIVEIKKATRESE
jgi:ribonuclease D